METATLFTNSQHLNYGNTVIHSRNVAVISGIICEYTYPCRDFSGKKTLNRMPSMNFTFPIRAKPLHTNWYARLFVAPKPNIEPGLTTALQSTICMYSARYSVMSSLKLLMHPIAWCVGHYALSSRTTFLGTLGHRACFTQLSTTSQHRRQMTFLWKNMVKPHPLRHYPSINY